jgi:hypothetical protein
MMILRAILLVIFCWESSVLSAGNSPLLGPPLIHPEVIYPESPFHEKTGFNPNLKIALDISYVSNISSSDRVTFVGGGGFNYFFTREVGAFAEAQYNNRGFNQGGQTLTAAFLDVPVGVVFNLPHDYFSETARSHLKVGGFYAATMGNFSGPLQVPFSPTSAGFWGIYLATESLYPLDDLFSIGWTVWGKFALTTSLADGTDAKFYNLGLGFIAALF